jgi:hypothetical protein
VSPSEYPSALDTFKRRDAIIVGSEFTGTSISSNLSAGWIETYRKALKANLMAWVLLDILRSRHATDLWAIFQKGSTA